MHVYYLAMLCAPRLLRCEHSLVLRASSAFKMARRNHWTMLYSKNCGVFCHVTHDEMAFSDVISSEWQPYLFSSFSETVEQTKRIHLIAANLMKHNKVFGVF